MRRRTKPVNLQLPLSGVEPPIVRTDDRSSSHEAAARIQPTRGSKREKVLALLQRNGRAWTLGSELTTPDVGGSEGMRRLRELRQMGWDYESQPLPGGRTSWKYRLKGEG
jgi:hypothetical protein